MPPAGAPLLEGARVLLRRPTPADEAEFTALNRRSARFHRGLAYPPTTPDAFASYLSRCGAPDYDGMLVCRREDGVILGAANLSQIFRGNFGNAYLGYQVGALFAGQGYMGEALELVLRHTFQGLRLHRVEANIQPGNTASIALVRRAGFTLEGFSRRYLKVGGRWRDHERWAILVEDWNQQQGERRTTRRSPPGPWGRSAPRRSGT